MCSKGARKMLTDLGACSPGHFYFQQLRNAISHVFQDIFSYVIKTQKSVEYLVININVFGIYFSRFLRSLNCLQYFIHVCARIQSRCSWLLALALSEVAKFSRWFCRIPDSMYISKLHWTSQAPLKETSYMYFHSKSN